MKYVITTGWWHSDFNESKVDREAYFGDEEIRGVDFHTLWYKAIRATGSQSNIYIIDSASPVKPLLSEGEHLIQLEENFGHSTKTKYKLAGVTRAHLMGMTIALLNEYDYWVYIEQDALVYGKDIIEKCIGEMTKPFCFGDGSGTPQPSQQSFMIIKSEYIPQFIQRLTSIRSSDKQISPELKFCIASSMFLKLIPEVLYRHAQKQSVSSKITRKILYFIIKHCRGFCAPSFGYGRTRPINFSDSHYYFQHGEKQELEQYLKHSKVQDTQQ